MMDERREGRPTAYVLGELTAEEKAEFEAELKDNAALSEEVEEIRERAELLGREMAQERASLPPEVRARIEAAAVDKQAAMREGEKEEEKKKGGAMLPPQEDLVIPLAPATKKPLFRRASFWMGA